MKSNEQILKFIQKFLDDVKEMKQEANMNTSIKVVKKVEYIYSDDHNDFKIVVDESARDEDDMNFMSVYLNNDLEFIPVSRNGAKAFCNFFNTVLKQELYGDESKGLGQNCAH